jgi:WD40 repeat protein
MYRFRKFARRNKVALAIATAVALVVLLAVAGLATSTILIAREHQATGIALQAETQALEAETQARAELEQALERERQTSYYQRIDLAEREPPADNPIRVQQLLDACPAGLRGWEWHYLNRLFRLGGIPPLHHPRSFCSVAYSHNGKWIASGDQDGYVTVWDAATRQELQSFHAHEINARVTFSPDGQRLASAGLDKTVTVKVWNFDPQRAGGQTSLHLTLPPEIASGGRVAFSPDGLHIASPGTNNTVRVWDAATGREIFNLPGHARPVLCVAYSPDGRYLASGSADKTVKIWDVRQGLEKLPLRGHAAQIVHVAYSRDGKQLVSVANDSDSWADGELNVWDVQTGRKVFSLRGHTCPLYEAAFSPDGRRLASAGLSHVKLWDLTTGQEALTLRGHGEAVRSVAFSPDGNRIVTAGRDRTLRIWDGRPVPPGEEQGILTLEGHDRGVRGLAFGPDGRHLASVGNDATVRIWDFERVLAGAADPLIQKLPGRVNVHLNVAFSHNGRLLASAGEKGQNGEALRVWDTAAWKDLYTVANANCPVAFSPDDRYLAADSGQAGPVRFIKIVDATTGQEVQTLKGRGFSVTAMVFCPNPRSARLAVTHEGAIVHVWDVKAAKEIVDLSPHFVNWVCSVAFSKDGKWLACGGDKVVKIWDSETWKLHQELQDPGAGVLSVAFHPWDSRLIAWGSHDGRVKVGNTATKEIRILPGHQMRGVTSVAFSPDGEWIASSSTDGTIKLRKVPLFPPAPNPPDRVPGIVPFR